MMHILIKASILVGFLHLVVLKTGFAQSSDLGQGGLQDKAVANVQGFTDYFPFIARPQKAFRSC
jgi:hypothetical protein